MSAEHFISIHSSDFYVPAAYCMVALKVKAQHVAKYNVVFSVNVVVFLPSGPPIYGLKKQSKISKHMQRQNKNNKNFIEILGAQIQTGN